ncbi:hypothetical protein PIROE2DRAFT_9746 [Piromyces sp. E2]|nr:hypothetical protein PIROE2DRAFT_9746 [Piromyces sp. E2]|eukprot:OUM63673.1 hypothetical protein PIROE2DRAFT_9746 [Piromyces sp. E2]
MDNKEKIQNSMSKEKDIHIEVLENENFDVSIQSSSQFPKNPSLPKESDFSSEKIIKEKQGKSSKKDLSLNEININSLSINNHSVNNIHNSLNNINTNSFNNMNTSFNNSLNNINHSFQQNTSTNNQDNILKGKEESLQQVIRINLNNLYNNPPVMNDQRILTTQVPKSIEDWIENHSKKALENPISPETPPSYIPVLETTEDLDEIITPKRSVSCRARNHNTLRQMKVMNQSQNLLPPPNPNNNVNNSMNHSSRHNSSTSRKHQLSRQSPMIHISENEHYHHRSGNISIDTDSLRRLQKGIPKFQMCSYKHCEFIATDRCEKCYDPLCLNHMKRFYYTLHMFSGKNLCINCFRKTAKSYLWFYISIGIFATVVLIVIASNSEFREKIKLVNQCIVYFILSAIAIASFILARLCKSLVTFDMTQPTTY